MIKFAGREFKTEVVRKGALVLIDRSIDQSMVVVVVLAVCCAHLRPRCSDIVAHFHV